MVPIQEIREKLDKQHAILLDVREFSEWEKDHLKRASQFPFSKIMNGELPKLSDKKIIYVLCAAGVRAKIVADLLVTKGFQAYPLECMFHELVSLDS